MLYALSELSSATGLFFLSDKMRISDECLTPVACTSSSKYGEVDCKITGPSSSISYA